MPRKAQFIIIISLLAVAFGVFAHGEVSAAFNTEINYQGKLTDTSDNAVADGDYNFKFQLCTDSACAASVWSETRETTNKVTVTNGLFSVLLGSVTSIASVDFNQALWLEVQVGGTGSSPSYETLTPRKKLGAVAAAFEADKLDGLDSTAFLRVSNNLSDLAATSTAIGNLGLTIGTDVQAYDDELRDIASTTPTKGDILTSDGTDWLDLAVGTDGYVLMASSTASNGIGWTNIITDHTALDQIGDPTSSSTIEIASTTLTIDSAGASSTLVIDGDLGRVTINDLTISTSSTLLADLGLTIGTDVQAYDDELRDIASSTPTKGDILTSDGTDWLDLAVGTDGYVLMASSTASNGIGWTNIITDHTALDQILDPTASSTIEIASTTLTIDSAGASSTLVIDGDLGRVTINDLTISTSSTLLADLGLTIGTDVQAYDDELRDIASTTPTLGDILTSDGTDWLDLAVGTDGYVLMASSTASNGIGWTNIITDHTALDQIGDPTSSSTIEIASTTLTIDSAGASSTLVIDGDLGRVTINDLTISTSSTLLADLGLTIGTDVQAYDDELRDIASSTPTKGDILTSDGTDWLDLAVGTDGYVLMASSTASNGIGWTNIITDHTALDQIGDPTSSSTIEIASTTLTIDSGAASSTLVIDGDLGRVTINDLTISTSSTLLADLGLTIGTDVQAYDDELRDIASSTPTLGDLIVSDGTDWLDLSIGANGNVLVASSTASNGLAWSNSTGITDVGTLVAGATGSGFGVDLDSSTLTCTDCIDFSHISDTPALDASTTIEFASSSLTIDSAAASSTLVIDGDTGRVTINDLTITSSSTLLADLGLTIGTDVQAYDDELRDIASSTPTKGDILTSDGTDWLDLAIGTNGYVLTASSTDSDGLAWSPWTQITGVGTLLSGATGAGFTIDADNSTWTCALCILAGDYAAASIDGDDIASGIAGRSLTLTAASPDTLDADEELYTGSINFYATGEDFDAGQTEHLKVLLPLAITVTEVFCHTTGSATSTLNITVSQEASPGTAFDQLMTSDLSCSSTAASSTVATSSIAARDFVMLDVTDTNATGTEAVIVDVLFTKDD